MSAGAFEGRGSLAATPRRLRRFSAIYLHVPTRTITDSTWQRCRITLISMASQKGFELLLAARLKPMAKNKLTARQVDARIRAAKRGVTGDGDGLYLRVSKVRLSRP